MRATSSMIASEIRNIAQDLFVAAERIKESTGYSIIQISAAKNNIAEMRRTLNELNRYVKAYEKEISSK